MSVDCCSCLTGELLYCHLCFPRCDSSLSTITSFTEIITNCVNSCHRRPRNLWTVWHVSSANALSISVVQVDIMMAFRGIRVITPLILTRSSIWRWLVSITTWLVFAWGSNPTAIGCECGWAPRASLDVLEKRKILFLCQDSNPGPSSPKPSHCSDYTVLVSMLGLLDVSSVGFRIMNSCVVFGTTQVVDTTLVTDVTSFFDFICHCISCHFSVLSMWDSYISYVYNFLVLSAYIICF